MSDSVRHLLPQNDTMRKYHSEIERLVYAAERVCDDMQQCNYGLCSNRECVFAPARDAPNQTCGLLAIRATLGDVVEQHDTGDHK